MAHFALVDDNNIVTNVIVVPDEQEHRGAEFCADDLGLGGTWIQTSYNNNIRKQFASIGSIYNPDFDEFLDPQPVLLYTSPSPRDLSTSRMPSSA